MRRVTTVLLIPFLLVLAFWPPATYAQQNRLTVFAAASLSDAMRAIDQAWVTKSHPALRLSFASSSTLARQLDHGANANLFASADEAWMDWAAERHLIVADTRRNIVSTQLVLVVPKDKAQTIEIKHGFDLAALLGPRGRLAVGDPAHVPAGRYARQALTSLGIWPSVSHRLAAAENVRSALLLVERGEAPAGIVYETDAAASSNVAVAGTFPADSHDPINYPFAITRTGDTPAAHALLDFIDSPEGHEIFSRFGFKTE
jgi:molybdate transport system substrate-binding protein